ncbi:YIP1 family protein [Methanofollis ethanolicus]|uniref:YIP1 family protein n=1 Tax=Methanofollis ethanolicus TaxID=488124 RepID=UPI00083596B0|nr:YIP1 family protein [Methanofollis ethanolicus]
MRQTIVERAQGFLINPVETFRDARADYLGAALVYFGTLLAVNLVLLCLLVIGGLVLVSGGEPGLIVFAVLVSVIADAIGTIVLFVLAALTLHLFVVLLIGGKGIKETIKTLAYAATPGLLLGWVPLIGILAWLWTLGLAAVGVRELHETSTGRAAGAVIPVPGIALVLFFIALVVVFSNIPEGPSYLSTRYTYDLSIQTRTPIENVTFLLPVPTYHNRPAIGPEPITDDFYSSRLPENVTSTLVLVDGRHYLRLTTPHMDAGDEISLDYQNYTSLGQNFSPEVVPQLVNTLYPFNNESLFSSGQNLTHADCSPGEVKTHGTNPGYSCTYAIPISAYYDNGTQVEISSGIEGANDWREFFDAWISNHYSDRYHLTITGEPQGWTSANGRVVAGSGVYREWQVGPLPASDA